MAVVVGLLQEELEPVAWWELNVRTEMGVNCEHLQALLTNEQQRHWEWHGGRWEAWVLGFFKYQTAEGREGICWIRHSRDGVSSLTVHDSVEAPEGVQTRTVESRNEVAGQDGNHVRVRTR